MSWCHVMMCAVLSKTLILLTELLTVRADKDLKELQDCVAPLDRRD